MKGTDCTPGQIESASGFLGDRGWPSEGLSAVITRDDAVRLIAWYGALRFVAGRDGSGGTLEQPGVLEVVNRKEVTSMRNHEGAAEETDKPVDQGEAEEGQQAGQDEKKPEPEGD